MIPRVTYLSRREEIGRGKGQDMCQRKRPTKLDDKRRIYESNGFNTGSLHHIGN